MIIPDNFSESLETVFLGLKMIKFFDPDPDPGSGILSTLDPGWKKNRIRDKKNIPDPARLL
jgi:hypothetical protein